MRTKAVLSDRFSASGPWASARILPLLKRVQLTPATALSRCLLLAEQEISEEALQGRPAACRCRKLLLEKIGLSEAKLFLVRHAL